MSPNTKPHWKFREKDARESDPKEFLDSEPGNSLKAKECCAEITLGQGGLVFITTAEVDATTQVSWCHSVSGGPQNIPDGQHHQ